MTTAFLRTDLRRPSLQRLPAVIVIAALACGLGGCGTVNHYAAIGFENVIPAWAGGLPSDAPPRPGTAEYDEFIRKREEARLQPAAPKDDAKKDEAPASTASTPLALGPIH
jgi:hypothetical protein